MGRTVDDKLFNSFTKTDWEYYDAMIYQDEQEIENQAMRAIEYMALFSNPERLKKWNEIRNSDSSINNREIRDGSVVSSGANDEEFAKFVAQKFMTEDGKVPDFRKR